jgi:site-specific recombinase XerD
MKTYQDYVKEYYSVSVHKEALRAVKLYLAYIIEPLKASEKDILTYIEMLRKQSTSPRTLIMRLSFIKNYYGYLQKTKQIQVHPCLYLYLKDKTATVIKTELLYTQSELEDYFTQTAQEKKLMVSLLVFQGLTCSEIVQLQSKDIDIEKGQIELKDRVLSLQAMQIHLVMNHLKKHSLTQVYLFETKNAQQLRPKWVNEYINYKRKDKKKPLTIRQSVIRNLLKMHDLRVVQVFAGHRKSTTTEKYRTNNFEDLQADIHKLHPLNNKK